MQCVPLLGDDLDACCQCLLEYRWPEWSEMYTHTHKLKRKHPINYNTQHTNFERALERQLGRKRNWYIYIPWVCNWDLGKRDQHLQHMHWDLTCVRLQVHLISSGIWSKAIAHYGIN